MFSLQTTTLSDLLRRTDELSIFKHYISGYKGPYIKFNSELRKDVHPSCIIYNHGGQWFYKDYGNNEVYTCIGYVMKLLNCDYSTALSNINEAVKGNDTEPTSWSPGSCSIEIKPRSFNSDDIKFWEQYGGTIGALKKYNIVPIDSYTEYCGHSILKKYCTSLTYSIENGDGNRRKIYAPYDKSHKWVSTVVGDWLMGYDQLPWTGKLLIITKSMKDIITLNSFGYTAVSPHSESQNIASSRLRQLEKRFERIVVHYDFDDAGMEGAEKLNKLHGYQLFYTEDPENKDISDFYKSYGKNSTMDILKHMENAIQQRG